MKRSATFYFILTFSISWMAAFLLIAPKLWRGETLQKLDGLLMFPLILLGPPISCLVLTIKKEGRSGLKNLRSRFSFRGIKDFRWVTYILIPPLLIFIVLMFFSHLISPVYSPNFFPSGFVFGILAGVLEEIGWSGYAFPALRVTHRFFPSAIILGVLWALWHIPVIDFLGSASPHGNYLPVFFLAFTFVMMAIRVLICMVYSQTNSLIPAMLLHASSTGCLAAFSPPHVSAGQEVAWYIVYGVFLWLIILVLKCRNNFISMRIA